MFKKCKKVIVVTLVALLIAAPASYLPVHAYDPKDQPSIQKNHPTFDATDCEDTEGTSYAYTDLDNSTLPGEGNPAGLVSPKLSPQKMAEAINKYIKDKFPNSPFNGLGAKIVASAQAAGINPFLLVALAQQESSLGTNGNLSKSPAHNAFGRSASARQPHVTSGGRMWYQWDSIAQSVDHTDPRNKEDPAGSGDMASYIANVYGDQIDNNDLRAFIEEYAPGSDGNDVNAYITNAQKTINDLAKLAGVTNPDPNGSGDDSDSGTKDDTKDEETKDQQSTDSEGGQEIPPCEPLTEEEAPEDDGGEDDGENDEDTGEIGGDCKGGGSAAATAVCFAWSKYLGRGYQKKKPSYAKAISAAQKRGEYIGGCTGVDCGGFTTRAMRDSGADKNFNKSECNTVCQRSYMRSSSKYQRLGYVTSSSKLSPGDIAVSSSHTFMWVGNQPGHSTKIASASLCDRAPMAGVESIRGIEWFHLK